MVAQLRKLKLLSQMHKAQLRTSLLAVLGPASKQFGLIAVSPLAAAPLNLELARFSNGQWLA